MDIAALEIHGKAQCGRWYAQTRFILDVRRTLHLNPKWPLLRAALSSDGSKILTI